MNVVRSIRSSVRPAAVRHKYICWCAHAATCYTRTHGATCAHGTLAHAAGKKLQNISCCMTSFKFKTPFGLARGSRTCVFECAVARGSLGTRTSSARAYGPLAVCVCLCWCVFSMLCVYGSMRYDATRAVAVDFVCASASAR